MVSALTDRPSLHTSRPHDVKRSNYGEMELPWDMMITRALADNKLSTNGCVASSIRSGAEVYFRFFISRSVTRFPTASGCLKTMRKSVGSAVFTGYFKLSPILENQY